MLIAPARSAGASYSETGVSNDQVSVRCPSDVCTEKTVFLSNVSASVDSKFTTVIFSVDFQGAEEKCVCAVKE